MTRLLNRIDGELLQPIRDVDIYNPRLIAANALVMKRKLDQDDASSELPPLKRSLKATDFKDFRLDSKVLRAVTERGFSKPTLVQAEAIPLALAGRNILGNNGEPSS